MRSRTLTPLKQLITALMQTPFHPHICEVNGKQLPLMRLEIPIEIGDLLNFLNIQTLFPKIYWENPKEKMKVAAIGKVLELDTVPIISAQGGPRFFGGQDFADRKHDTWKNFPSSRYILPLIEIEEREGISFLCINRVSENFSIDLKYEENPFEISKPLSRLDSPSYSVWKRHIKEILGLISQKIHLKVVLARCTRFEFEKTLNPYAILKQLQGKSPSATLFAFQFEKDQAFIGASPETLYKRKERLIKSEAVAGTRPRGNTPEEDLRLSKELLNNQKEIHECTLVKESIENSLSPLCQKLHIGKRNILQTSTVQHITHSFEGSLKKPISDQDLIAALHPTPAIGGLPKKGAIKEIQKREYFDRGWYSAPVGWVTRQQAHHIVAIRSALIEKNLMHLFAGSGIVKGSIPLNEWEELEQKISQYILWED